MWFSFDGAKFRIHYTEDQAKANAEQAMETWLNDAVDNSDGWDGLSTQVCYGLVTHSVYIENVPVTESNRHLVPSNCDSKTFERHTLVKRDAQELKAAIEVEDLAQRVIDVCKNRGWSLHWAARGAYLHLEVSELIEAIRGKRGDPTEEAGDVLIVLLSIMQHAGISWKSVIESVKAKLDELELCPRYPDEEFSA